MKRRDVLFGAGWAMAGAAAATESDEAILRAQLSILSDLVHARDMALLDRFTPDGVLLGSETRDNARGRQQLAAHLTEYYTAPLRLSWTWDRVDGQINGDTAWLLAQGFVVLEDEKGGVTRKPYRLSGALVRRGDVWLWRMFHGSEPLP